jgi:Trypsin
MSGEEPMSSRGKFLSTAFLALTIILLSDLSSGQTVSTTPSPPVPPVVNGGTDVGALSVPASHAWYSPSGQTNLGPLGSIKLPTSETLLIHVLPDAVVNGGTDAGYVVAVPQAVASQVVPNVVNGGTDAGYVTVLSQALAPRVIPNAVVNGGTDAGYVTALSQALASRVIPNAVVNGGTDAGYVTALSQALTSLASPNSANGGTGFKYILLPAANGASQVGNDIASNEPATSILTPEQNVAGSVPASISRSRNPTAKRLASVIPLSQNLKVFSFLELDSHLRDCDVPFDKLLQESPFCKQQNATSNNQSPLACIHYSSIQFPEVVKLAVLRDNSDLEYCTATMVSDSWALTAAHCFLDRDGASLYNNNTGQDIEWKYGNIVAHVVDAYVDAEAAILLSNISILQDANLGASRSYTSGIRRSADYAYVNGAYTGKTSTPNFDEDLALVHISPPYPSYAVQPAGLASEFSEDSTIPGYGYANGGAIGKFTMGWTGPLKQVGHELHVNPQEYPRMSEFCQGDSGGPVFAKRLRGCRQYDVFPEERPHRIEGIISNNALPKHTVSSVVGPEQASLDCEHAADMSMVDITRPTVRQWICHRTNNAVQGCS